MRSSYEIIRVDNREDKVFIEDLNIGKSVTNDAEEVVEELNNQFPEYRIIYKDSMGNWDELCHDLGSFTGFAPYNESFSF